MSNIHNDLPPPRPPTVTGGSRLSLKIFTVFLVGAMSIVRLLRQQLVIFKTPELSFDLSAPTVFGFDDKSNVKPKLLPDIPQVMKEKPIFPKSPTNVDRSYYDKPIRNWGCHRTETPLIFVHIGKAGGGMIRARLAAAAQDYTRGEKWRRSNVDDHYYPVSDTEKAYFCNGRHKHHRFPNSTMFYKSHEGFLPCRATTPIGMSLACPETPTKRGFLSKCPGCMNLLSDTCHTVYVGHTALGSELHYLPPKYLHKWWRNNNNSSGSGGVGTSGRKDGSTKNNLDMLIRRGFERLLPMDQRWCTPIRRQARPKNLEDAYEKYDECSTALSTFYDDKFQQFWQQRQQQQQQSNNLAPSDVMTTMTDYSSLYASLPVQRITMLREPYSWLLSKFYWHKLSRVGYKCDDIGIAGMGWIQTYCIDYLMQLCGDDCPNRLEAGVAASLEEFERQAANNLRTSISVVGLLNETETFYDMVSTRIKYVDMSLNPEVKGDEHHSIKLVTAETERCKALYDSDEFQESLKESVPIVATIERLYKLGVKVNRHQMDELNACAADPLDDGEQGV